MKRKIICVVLCVVLLLIFTSSSFGAYDPDWYQFREHPEQELVFSPPKGDQSGDVILIIIPNRNGLSVVVYVKNDSPKEDPTSQKLTDQGVKSSANNSKRVR